MISLRFIIWYQKEEEEEKMIILKSILYALSGLFLTINICSLLQFDKMAWYFVEIIHVTGDMANPSQAKLIVIFANFVVIVSIFNIFSVVFNFN